METVKIVDIARFSSNTCTPFLTVLYCLLFHQTAEEVLDEVLNASSSEDSDGDNVPLAASLKKKKVQVNSEVTVIPWI